VLLDRGFYNFEIAKAIDEIGIEFIIFFKNVLKHLEYIKYC